MGSIVYKLPSNITYSTYVLIYLSNMNVKFLVLAIGLICVAQAVPHRGPIRSSKQVIPMYLEGGRFLCVELPVDSTVSTCVGRGTEQTPVANLKAGDLFKLEDESRCIPLTRVMFNRDHTKLVFNFDSYMN